MRSRLAEAAGVEPRAGEGDTEHNFPRLLLPETSYLGARSCAQRRAMPSPLPGSPVFTVFLEPRSGRGWLCPQGTFGSDVLSLPLQVSGTGWGPRWCLRLRHWLSFLSFSPMQTASRRLCNVGT